MLYPLHHSPYRCNPSFWLFQLALLNSSSLQCNHNTNNWLGPSKRSFLLRLTYGIKSSQISTWSTSLPWAIAIPTPSRRPSMSSSSISLIPMAKLHLRCLPSVRMWPNGWLLMLTHQYILFLTTTRNWKILLPQLLIPTPTSSISTWRTILLTK